MKDMARRKPRLGTVRLWKKDLLSEHQCFGHPASATKAKAAPSKAPSSEACLKRHLKQGRLKQQSTSVLAVCLPVFFATFTGW